MTSQMAHRNENNDLCNENVMVARKKNTIATLVTNLVTNYEGGKDWIVITTNRTDPLSFPVKIFRNGKQK